jgi:Raf kinase inhibitor-like YbhB/YbcL family protein
VKAGGDFSVYTMSMFENLENSMNRIRILSLMVVLLVSGAAGAQQAPSAPAGPPRPALVLASSAFKDNEVIPDKFTGAASMPVSPSLSWSNVPENTQSFAIIFHDMESSLNRTNNEVIHWLAFNIPGTAIGLPEGVPSLATLPDGTIQPTNLRRTFGYMGPGAPPGNYHHYAFELYALDTKLSLTSSATRDDVVAAMNGHINAKAILVGRFHH